MKANELRENNWYRCKIYNGNKDVLMQFTLQEYKYIHLFEPIPITPEILEKCGFEYKPCGISGSDMWQGMGFWNIKNCDWVSFRGGFFRTKPIELILTGYFNSRIQYLHQLQNLYFALTGEELEVNL